MASMTVHGFLPWGRASFLDEYQGDRDESSRTLSPDIVETGITFHLQQKLVLSANVWSIILQGLWVVHSPEMLIHSVCEIAKLARGPLCFLPVEDCQWKVRAIVRLDWHVIEKYDLLCFSRVFRQWQSFFQKAESFFQRCGYLEQVQKSICTLRVI